MVETVVRTVRASAPLTESGPPRRRICLCCRPPAARQRRGVDEAFLVVTLTPLEVVDLSMASPAPVEAPVQRGGFR